MSQRLSADLIKTKIVIIRGRKVMLDKDLAELYGVKPIRLREQVKRNSSRFPEDFMFRLTRRELDDMVSHFAIPSKKYFGGYLPYVFTEQGVSMLSSVLNSERAIQVNIAIMRAFVRIREMMVSQKELALKLDKLQQLVGRHDKEIKAIFEVIRQLMSEPIKPKQRIGFRT